jgi:penicillin-binding protein 1A
VSARIGRPVAGKTGTSDEWADAWFVGYTPDLVAAVWVGFPDEERPMRPPTTRVTVTGGSWPAQIWQLFAGGALAERTVADFPAVAPAPTATTTRPPSEPGRPPMIDLVGKNVPDATRALRDAGYQVRLAPTPSRTVPVGIVLGQDPRAGDGVKPGITVTIQVSSGPPKTAIVPSVLGAYADEAAFRLRAAGFEPVITVTSEPPPGDPTRAGRVWKQTPITGAIADQGAKVTISVNPS